MGKIAFALDRRYYFNPTFAFASKGCAAQNKKKKMSGYRGTVWVTHPTAVGG